MNLAGAPCKATPLSQYAERTQAHPVRRDSGDRSALVVVRQGIDGSGLQSKCFNMRQGVR